ncbi:hypothetical protein [Luteimonas sp. A501]
MTHRFNPALMKSQPINDLPPGFFWHLSPNGADIRLSLMLRRERPSYSTWIWLSGERHLHVQDAAAHALASNVGLHLGPIGEIEVPTVPKVGNHRESLGALIVCDAGSFLVAQKMVSGFEEAAYINLADLSVQDRIPSIEYGIFLNWRLVRPHATGRDVLLEMGDWT